MSSLATSIKSLSSYVEDADLSKMEISSQTISTATSNEKLKFICDNKELLFKAIDVAKIFTGPKGDKLLDTLKSVIESVCK